MAITVFVVLAIVALICAIAAAAQPAKVPLWVAVVVLCIIELIHALPLGAH